MRNQFPQGFKHTAIRIVVAALLVLTAFPCGVTAQQNNAAASAPTSSTVPQIIQFSGQLNGQSSDMPGGSAAVPAGTISITFTLYENEQGGTALWSETDNVQADAQGHYTALLGSASPEGLPMNLFTTVQAHWLAVQPLLPSFAEQPRVLLVSAPYALKAGDAETVGGLPPSAFVRAASGTSSYSGSSGGSAGTSSSTSGSGSPPQALGSSTGQPAPPLSGSGTKNYIPIWKTGTALGNSLIYQTGGKVGIGTTTPGSALDVNGYINTSAAYNIGGYTMLAAPGGPTIGNIAVGYQALASNPTGDYNTASGDIALSSNGSGSYNTADGYEALYSNTTGSYNTADGWGALESNTTASNNTASGFYALADNTTGGNNTASGYQALFSNTTGGANTASGLEALYNNTTGGSDTANGFKALYSNTTASDNTASGTGALFTNTTGNENTASGENALFFNTIGANNTASGYEALYSNTTGSDNTASGNGALYNNTTANGNTASGIEALYSNTTGSDNTASGIGALYSNTIGANNTASGNGALQSNTTGSNNVAIGFIAANNVSGANSNNIHIGSLGSSGDSGAIRIGTAGTQTSFFVAGVSGVTTGQNNAVPVLVDSNGQLGTVSSSRRFKEDIQDMGDTSQGLMRLRPVTFRYKQAFDDGSKPIQYGLIAEEVAEVYPDLVARSADGQIETVKYQLLDPMLLNEVQRQQKEMARQQAEAQLQQAKIRDLENRVKTQQALLSTQQAQIAELVSNVKTIQASLRTRRGSAHARLASAKDTPGPTSTTDASVQATSALRGGN